MMPKKILTIIEDLFNKTENGDLEWGYNDELATVYITIQDREYEISYNFLETYEEGQFRLKITKHGHDSSTDYYYDVRESENDYDKLKNLYDSAQASNL